MGFRKNTLAQPADRFFPKVGTSRAVTALMRFEPSAPGAQTTRVARLYFYDTMHIEAIDLNGVQVPLAADFTAPFGLLISRTELKSIGLSQTFSSEHWLDEAGFYMTEPFDPHKIPIITVHGLLSSPITWINLQNDLMDDPVLRQHYQIWHFFYPAGLPILVSAQLFREKLEELYTFFDPHGQFPALRNAVVIAHSMGGLLTKTAVSDSGDQLWERTFQKAPADLALSAALRQQLDRLLRFRRAPFITRVVFIAVPHRGSLLAESFAGRMGRMLIAVPATVLTPVRLVLEQAEAALTPDVKEALQEDPNQYQRSIATESDNPGPDGDRYRPGGTLPLDHWGPWPGRRRAGIRRGRAVQERSPRRGRVRADCPLGSCRHGASLHGAGSEADP